MPRPAVVALLAAAVTVSSPVPGFAGVSVPAPASPAASVPTLPAQLTDASTRAAAAAAALAETRTALVAARADAEQSRARLAAAKAAEQQAQAAVDHLSEDVLTAQAGTSVSASSVRTARTALGQFARAQYMSGGDTGLLATLVGTPTLSDLILRQQAAHLVAVRQGQVLGSLTAAQDSLRQQEESLQGRRSAADEAHRTAATAVARAQTLTQRVEAAAAHVERLAAVQTHTLAVLAQEKAAEQQGLAQASQDAQSIQARIAAVQGASLPAGAGDITLQWPVAGRPGGGVGPRTNPYTGNLSCHAGVDVSAPQGTPIHAAAAGTVVAAFASRWDGYVTVVAHAGGVVTWYAHQVSTAVIPDQVVAQGQVIGYVGATGFATGPHLHFNVQVNGVLYDPMGWFGGVMRAVAPLCAPPYPQPVP